MKAEKEKLYKQIITLFDSFMEAVERGNFRLEWELREEIAAAKVQLEDFEIKEKHAKPNQSSVCELRS